MEELFYFYQVIERKELSFKIIDLDKLLGVILIFYGSALKSLYMTLPESIPIKEC